MNRPNPIVAIAAAFIGSPLTCAGPAAALYAERPVTKTQGNVARAAPPLSETIRTLYEGGKHQEVLAAVSKILAVLENRRDARDGRHPHDEYDQYDEGELWELKAESHLRLKGPAAAAASFRKAAGSAEAAGKADHAAGLRDTVMLLERCDGLSYAPRTGGKSSRRIDIVDPAGRREALRALFAERKAAAAPKLAAVRTATDLGPMAKALDALADLRALELAAGGDGRETAGLAADVADPAADLLRLKLDLAGRRLAVIERQATEVLEEKWINGPADSAEAPRKALNGAGGSGLPLPPRPPPTITLQHLRGLSWGDDDELRAAAGVCRRLAPLAETLAELDPAGDRDVAAMAVEARDVARRADYLRSFNFVGIEIKEEQPRRP